VDDHVSQKVYGYNKLLCIVMSETYGGGALAPRHQCIIFEYNIRTTILHVYFPKNKFSTVHTVLLFCDTIILSMHG